MRPSPPFDADAEMPSLAVPCRLTTLEVRAWSPVVRRSFVGIVSCDTPKMTNTPVTGWSHSAKLAGDRILRDMLVIWTGENLRDRKRRESDERTVTWAPEETSTALNGDGTLSAKLDRLQTELLDLSARNRTPQHTAPSRYARNIEVVDERSRKVLPTCSFRRDARSLRARAKNPSLSVGDDTGRRG